MSGLLWMGVGLVLVVATLNIEALPTRISSRDELLGLSRRVEGMASRRMEGGYSVRVGEWRVGWGCLLAAYRLTRSCRRNRDNSAAAA